MPLPEARRRQLTLVLCCLAQPATLSILTTTFTEGAERNHALGLWGAMGALICAAVLVRGVGRVRSPAPPAAPGSR